MLWFPHNVKPRKVRGVSTSPEGRAVLYQAADESSVCNQELRCAKEGLCTMEDAQSTSGFGGQFLSDKWPREIMAESETQEFE